MNSAREDSAPTLPPGNGGSGAVFATTCWSAVIGARRASARRQEALEQLCSVYWLPLYGYMRRRGLSPQDAEDLTQNFLLYLIESDFLDRPDPLMGRFRGYLIGGLRHYLSAHFEREQAQKRGGRATFLDWSRVNAEDELRRLGTAPADPSQAYETTWALALLAQALKRLEAEQRAAGKERHFSVLKPFIGAPPGPGEYEGAARKLGASRANVAVWVHRLGHRYGELVKMEVAATLSDPADIEDEMRHLFRALQLSG